jgi:hypothetical protein
MTMYTGPSWNDMAEVCRTGAIMVLKTIGGATHQSYLDTEQLHANNDFVVQGTCDGRPIVPHGNAPLSTKPATYRIA